MSRIANITANKLNNGYNVTLKKKISNKAMYISKEDIAEFSTKMQEQCKRYDELLEPMGLSNDLCYKIIQKTKIVLKNLCNNIVHLR
ncbi:MAG: hypothetical protein LKG27_02520 [Clostridiaceae bacterium]|jgi:hypothetical protein|nr:hypothetical protein [Clostridiaceae bacterium]